MEGILSTCKKCKGKNWSKEERTKLGPSTFQSITHLLPNFWKSPLMSSSVNLERQVRPVTGFFRDFVPFFCN